MSTFRSYSNSDEAQQSQCLRYIKDWLETEQILDRCQIDPNEIKFLVFYSSNTARYTFPNLPNDVNDRMQSVIDYLREEYQITSYDFKCYSSEECCYSSEESNKESYKEVNERCW